LGVGRLGGRVIACEFWDNGDGVFPIPADALL